MAQGLCPGQAFTGFDNKHVFRFIKELLQALGVMRRYYWTLFYNSFRREMIIYNIENSFKLMKLNLPQVIYFKKVQKLSKNWGQKPEKAWKK